MVEKNKKTQTAARMALWVIIGAILISIIGTCGLIITNNVLSYLQETELLKHPETIKIGSIISPNLVKLEADTVACLKWDWADEFIKALNREEPNSYETFIKSEKCFLLEKGNIVEMLDPVQISGSIIGFKFQNKEIWAINHNLKNQ